MVFSWSKRFQKEFIVVARALSDLRSDVSVEFGDSHLNSPALSQVGDTEIRIILVKASNVHDMIQII